MPKHTKLSRASALFRRAVAALEEVDPAERVNVFEPKVLDRMFQALAPSARNRLQDDTPYDYLRRHRRGLQLLASIRLAIVRNYAVEGLLDGRTMYVSPDVHQWFDDGVMFVQGTQPFEGTIGLYQQGKVKFAVSKRDAVGGDELGPDDLLFVDFEEVTRRLAEKDPAPLTSAPHRLEEMLGKRVVGEHHYQAFFEQYPWAFGAQYRVVQSHRALDERSIPDFTGVRVRDGARDILEIKDPFLKLFRADGEFASDFNDAWNQAERYLDFTRTEHDYLGRKGLRFENPRCYLILGHGLGREEIARLRAKERMNPAIEIFTYDELLDLTRHTVALLTDLQSREGAVPAVAPAIVEGRSGSDE